MMENIDNMINEYKHLNELEEKQLDNLLEELDRKEEKYAKQKHIWHNLDEYLVYLAPALWLGFTLATGMGYINDTEWAVILCVIGCLILFRHFTLNRTSSKLNKTRKEISDILKLKVDVINRDYLVNLKEVVDRAQKAKEENSNRN